MAALMPLRKGHGWRICIKSSLEEHVNVTIDTDVPYGNAALTEVRQADDGTVSIEFAADPHGGPETLWFCFRLRRDAGGPAGPAQLVLRHCQNMLGNPAHGGLHPVISIDGGAWQRIDAGQPQALPDGRHNLVWSIDRFERTVDVATCYPYGPPEVEALVNDTGDYWSVDAIGASSEGRAIQRLSNDGGSDDDADKRPGVFFTARQHSSETPGSWVLDGVLRRFAQRAAQAPLTWCVPLTNIDGVINGDYGKDNFPWDLNRAWGNPPMRHETLVMQRDAHRWARRCRPMLCLDFHAPGLWEPTGLYLFVPDPKALDRVDLDQAHRRWIDVLRDALGEYASDDFARVADYPSRWAGVESTCNATRFFREQVQTAALTVECSYQSACGGELLMTVGEYRQAGGRIADAIIASLQETPAP
jgi:hypothetical protein